MKLAQVNAAMLRQVQFQDTPGGPAHTQRGIADMQAEPRRDGGKPVRALPGTGQLTIDEVPHPSKDGEKKADQVDTDSISAITGGAAPGSTAMDVEVRAFQGQSDTPSPMKSRNYPAGTVRTMYVHLVQCTYIVRSVPAG